MVWIGVVILGVLIAVAWAKRSYKKEFVRRHKGELGWAVPVAPCMLWLSDWWAKREPGRQEQRYAEAVYVGDRPDERRAIRLIRVFAKAWYCLAIGCVLVIGASLIFNENAVSSEQGIARPAFGQEDQYTLSVDGLTDQTEEITVTVEGVQPGEEVMAELFDTIVEKVKIQMLGENASLDEVRSDLNLPTVSDYGIRLEWSSHSDLVNDWGEIQTEKVLEEVEEEGKLISFSVRLTYASYESNYEIYVRLMPPVRDGEYLKGLLISHLGKKQTETIEDPVFYLPGQVEGRELSYRQKSDTLTWEYLLLAAAVAGMLIWLNHSRMKEEYEKRTGQLQRDYFQILTKMGILLRAGLTIRGAWERMVREYRSLVGENPKRRRYVYEEMFITWNQIRNGCPEGMAYMEFGRRCGTYAYVKFGTILEQNLKQGVGGISQALEREMTEALEERKNAALRRGEEAQTKLLLPMFLMLGIVLVVLLVPAFLSL